MMELAARTLALASREGLSRERAMELLASGGQLIDVRSLDVSRHDMLPGALNLPVESLCYEHSKLNSSRPVIVYGAGSINSSRAARLLACKGFSSIYHLNAPAHL